MLDWTGLQSSTAKQHGDGGSQPIGRVADLVYAALEVNPHTNKQPFVPAFRVFRHPPGLEGETDSIV